MRHERVTRDASVGYPHAMGSGENRQGGNAGKSMRRHRMAWLPGVIRRSGELFKVPKQIYAITRWIQPKPDGSRGKMHPKTAFLGSKTCKNKRIALFEQVLLPNRCFFCFGRSVFLGVFI